MILDLRRREEEDSGQPSEGLTGSLLTDHIGSIFRNENAAVWFQRTEDASRIRVSSFDETVAKK
jgi:hypothetical protein